MSGTGTRYSEPNVFEVDANGVPMAGAQLFFYETGTSIAQNTYPTPTLSGPANANPVIADANGRFGDIFLVPSPSYKVQLWTAPTTDNPTGSEVWSADPVGPNAGGAIQNTAGIIGETRAFAGPSTAIPSGWYLCYGQAISRSTYSAAFSVLGTIWGPGDGSTTFNLPDLRGRAPFGKDDMGGVAASRITSGVSGISGTTLGATGGDQAMQSHTHTINDAGHTHTITDPGHFHTTQDIATGSPFTDSGTTAGHSPSAGEPTDTKMTGITGANSATTGVTNNTTGVGSSQNMPPAAIVNWIIYLGV
jgi:microcystin-dependent protein